MLKAHSQRGLFTDSSVRRNLFNSAKIERIPRGFFFAAAPAAASIYTDAKIRNGTYVCMYVRTYVRNQKYRI